MSREVVVIGGGVIGLSTAYYCARKGHRVTVLERSPEQRDGCSFGNAGLVVPSHVVPLAAPGMVALGLKWMWNPASPFYIQPRLSWELVSWAIKFWRAANPDHVRRSAPLLRDLHLASRACFEELAALPDNDFGLVQKGLLMLCKTQHALDEEAKAAEQARQLGLPAEVLTANQAALFDPTVRMDILGAVHFPKDCHLAPHRFMAGLKKQLDRLGVRFAWGTEVIGWRTNITSGTAPVGRENRKFSSVSAAHRGRNRVEAAQTNTGEIRADEFVLCGGSWSPLAARALGLKLPMQAGKGYSLTLPNPRQLPQLSAIFTEARVAVTPMNGSLRFGGTMELAGLNETINPVRVQGIINAVPSYFPDFRPEDFDGVQPWRGLRPCSPDGLPYVGRTAKFSNLSIATGHAMLGLSLGPITGQLMAEILSDEPSSIDLHLLNPDRYA